METANILTQPIKTAVNRMDAYEEKSGRIISKYALLSGGACLLPYRIVDMVSTTITQTMMIRELCQLYNKEYDGKLINVALWSAMGSVFTKAITDLVGQLLGGSSENQKVDLTGAAIAAVYTATVGEFYKLHLRDGGTLDDIKISDFAEHFIDEFQRGNLNLDSFTNPKKLLNQFIS